MWKARPEDNRLPLNSSQPAQPAPTMAANPSTPVVKETPRVAPEPQRGDVGHIGKSVVIRGELSGSEDLYLDGEVEGSINLRDHKLVIGPNGKIKAGITVREIVVHGRVEGNVGASHRVELKRAATLNGDITTQRIVIEDGATFKGSVDIKEHAHDSMKHETHKPSNSNAFAATAGAVSSSMNAGATVSQSSFLEPK